MFLDSFVFDIYANPFYLDIRLNLVKFLCTFCTQDTLFVG